MPIKYGVKRPLLPSSTEFCLSTTLEIDTVQCPCMYLVVSWTIDVQCSQPIKLNHQLNVGLGGTLERIY